MACEFRVHLFERWGACYGQHVLQGKPEVSLIPCLYGQCESLHMQGKGMMWLWEGRAGRHTVRALLSVQKPYDCNSIGLIGEANWV